MTTDARFWMRTGAVLGGLGVILGALAAHGLEGRLLELYGGKVKMLMGTEIPAPQKYLADFKTAAEYQMYHALAILAVGLLPGTASQKSANVAGWCFLLGTILFSGSLYVLVLTGQTKLGMITPIGGVLFVVGWIALFKCVLNTTRVVSRQSSEESNSLGVYSNQNSPRPPPKTNTESN